MNVDICIQRQWEYAHCLCRLMVCEMMTQYADAAILRFIDL